MPKPKRIKSNNHDDLGDYPRPAIPKTYQHPEDIPAEDRSGGLEVLSLGLIFGGITGFLLGFAIARWIP